MGASGTIKFSTARKSPRLSSTPMPRVQLLNPPHFLNAPFAAACRYLPCRSCIDRIVHQHYAVSRRTLLPAHHVPNILANAKRSAVRFDDGCRLRQDISMPSPARTLDAVPGTPAAPSPLALGMLLGDAAVALGA